jgi:membrane protease YdiL (CAAX protease family)
VLGSVAKAIVYTRVFVGTRGSLLTVTLLHAAWNTSEVFLPLFPAATGDSRALVIAVGLQCLVAVVLVVVTGPARLSRSAP